jgi:AcrR family transcriptional regulator
MNHEEQRQELIEMARMYAHKHGWIHFSINQFCRDAHIAKKTFYKYFPNKEGLLNALVNEAMQAYSLAVQSGMMSEKAPDARLQAILRAVFEVSSRWSSARFLHDLQLIRPDTWQRWKELRGHLLGFLVQQAVEAQHQGVFRQDIPLAKLATLIGVLVERVLDPQVLAEAKLQPYEAAHLLATLLVDGLRVKA